jgi:ABC-type bacteriocin/lantibiotic exporter with double-glycine peptidase domain
MTAFIPITPTIPKYKQVPIVPFYSQFKDISSLKWQKVGCGITSLAMIIEYYTPKSITVEKLLTKGIESGAYDKNAGWIYQGLISLASEYGLNGKSYDFSKLKKDEAFTELKKHLSDGPVIASVHYKFDPKSTIPHLVVIDGVDDDTAVYYNDPASKAGQKTISVSDFQKGWKKRVIVIRPTVDVKNIV